MSDMKILAVDDSPTMRRIIINTLKRAGFNNVVEATDGRDALAKMPEMDGLTFVIHLRKTAEYKTLPVLMVTTRSVKEDILEAMKAGVNNYIVKPFTPDTLKAKIEQTLAG